METEDLETRLAQQKRGKKGLVDALRDEIRRLKSTIQQLKTELQQLKTREKDDRTRLADLERRLERAETDAAAAAEFFAQRSEELIARREQTGAARPCRGLLYKWTGALQDVIGLSRALDSAPEAELREFWAERYLQRVRQLGLEPPPEEDGPDFRAEWESARRAGLSAVVEWWTGAERELKEGAGALRAQSLTAQLRPLLARLREMTPADCLTPEGLAHLRRTADRAESGLEALGFFPAFYGSEQTRAQMELDPEVANAFNEGDSASVEIPAVFLRRDGRWELLSGCVGMTLLK